MSRHIIFTLVVLFVLSLLSTGATALAEPAPPADPNFWLVPADAGNAYSGEQMTQLLASYAPQLHEWQQQGLLAAFRPLPEHGAILLEQPDDVLLHTIAALPGVKLIEPASAPVELNAQGPRPVHTDPLPPPQPVPAFALSPLGPAPQAPDASFIVLSTADAPDANPGDGLCADSSGACTLRAAIQESNALAGADQIALPAGTYSLSLIGFLEDQAATGDLDIRGDLTISGDPSFSTVIQDAVDDRVFHIHTGNVTFDHLTIRHGNANLFDTSGCGILLAAGASLTVENSTISNNFALSGGGIYTEGTLNLRNTTISNNNAEGGGAVDVRGGVTTLSNVTVSNNYAYPAGGGGGIRGDFTARNSIIANNDSANPDCYGTLTSLGYNLVEDDTGCTIEGDLSGLITGVDPLLGSLQNDGGPTSTHPLNAGSPALDAGNPTTPGSGGDACLATDQRGEPRPYDGDRDGSARCDIGAYERDPTIHLTEFISYLGETFVEGTLDGSGVPITLTLRAGTTTRSQVSTVAGGSSFNAYFDVPIAGGNTIDVQLGAQDPINVSVADLSAAVDKGADTMSGSGPANQTLTALLFSYYDWRWYYEYPTAGAGGSFVADFGDQADMFIGDGYQLWHYDPAAYPYTHRTVLRNGRAAGVTADPAYDSVWGYAAPGATVNLTLENSSGTTVATAAPQANSNGYYYTQFYAPGLVDIDTGHQITIAFDDYGPQTLTVPHVSVDSIDTATDEVSGVAPPSSKLEIYVDDPYQGASSKQIIYAGSGGAFNASFGGLFDLLPGSYASLQYHDAADNEVTPAQYYAGPYARVSLNSYYDLYAVDLPGETIAATLRNNLGAIKGSASGVAGPSGTVNLRFLDSIGNDVNPVAGDSVDVVYGSGSARTVQVVHISYVIDRQARTVTGTGPANSLVRLNYDYDQATADVSTGSDGAFSHTFSSRLTGGYSLTAYYRNQNGDDIQVNGSVPQFTVTPNSRTLYGYGPAAASVVGRLEDAGRSLKATSSSTTSSDGWYSLSFNAPMNVGDWVVVDAGELHFEQQIVSLTVAADTTNNLVTGTAPNDAWLNVFAQRSFGPYQIYNYQYFYADSSGNFAAAFADVRGGDHLRVLYWEDGHKDRIQITGYALPYLSISHTSDLLSGYAEPSSSGAVTIRASGGAVKATGSLFAGEPYGYFRYEPDNVNIVPGDTVEISLGSLDRTVEVIPLSANIDLATDTVSGSSLASTEIGVQAYHWDGSYYSNYASGANLGRFVTTNATGNFTTGFSAQADLQSGDYAGLFYMDAQDTAYNAYFYTTNPTIAVADYPTTVQPNQPVEIQLGLSGAHSQNLYVRWDTESHADDDFYAYSSPSQQGVIGQNVVTIVAPAGGTIYFKGYAQIDGQTVWSEERAINVSATAATTITDPVSGTTNDATPSIRGVTSPNAAVTLYEGAGALATATADATGRFNVSLSTPLSNGAHELYAVAEVGGVQGPASNTVHLTVDPALPVDPVHILLTSRGQTQHLRDDSGYANLGGRVWTRTGDTVSIAIPISYTTVYTADLYVGGVYAASLLDSGDDVYVGSYSPPGSGTYSVDLRVRIEDAGGPILTTNILTGLIDPDGYVYDAGLGIDHRIAGATVICYELVGDTWQYWPAAIWEQVNPQTTASDGYYAFFTLPGSYKIVVSAPGYRTYESPTLTVVDAPVRHNVPLEPLEPPQASCAATPLNGLAPLSVTFTNESSGDYHTSLWDFGDGANSGEENPVHVYTEPGIYDVSLTVTGPEGVDAVVRSQLITVYTPSNANFTADVTNGNAPLTVTFTNNSSGDYDSCTWNFGDGDSSAACTGAQHTYDTPGAYTVSLAVSGNGGEDTETKAGYITVTREGYAIFLPVVIRP